MSKADILKKLDTYMGEYAERRQREVVHAKDCIDAEMRGEIKGQKYLRNQIEVMLDEEESMEVQKALLNLLAVIHRDGGHHTDEVGLLQSIKDAKDAYYALRSENS